VVELSTNFEHVQNSAFRKRVLLIKKVCRTISYYKWW